MSDFFMPTQKNDYFSKYENKNQNTRSTQSDYWQNQSQKTMEQKQAQLDNRERYGVNVPDEYYDVFNKIISQAESPEKAQEEAYKIGSAVRYSQMMSIPLEEAYKNVDALNEAQFPDKADQKGRFEAISDMFTLGKNNVRLGELGQKLMKAHRENDTELAQALMTEIDAINQQNQLMQDNAPRSWVMQALEAGAQSLPFTGAVAGAGILGNFIAPAVGTGASFAASSYLSAGTEYIDMLANGASPETARAVAMVSGGIQGLIEADLGITKGIVKGAARIAGKEVAESTAKKGLEEIGRKVFKRFHFGAGKKVLINYLENRGKDILGEGTEEFLQEITSIVGQEVAASLDGYDIPDDDFKHIVKQTTEAFRGGILGALSMGFIPAGLNAAADVKSFKAIKDGAEVIESEEVFKEAVKDNPVFEGMSDQQKTETIHDVWERAQNRKEEAVNLEAQKIAEGLDAGEGAEQRKTTTDENGNVIEDTAEPVARNEAGRLYTSDEVSIDDNGNVTGGIFVIGDKTKSENNRYGYIRYETAENGDITITVFKMNKDRYGLRGEAFDEFAREHPDVKIDWNAIGSEAQGFKDELIEANPSGSKNGLSYYSSDDLDNIAARKQVADEVRRNIHNVKHNADGSFTRTELSNKQVAAAVTLIESAARRMNMGLNDYVSKTFGNQIFGSREEFEQATLAQGENVNTKAGGMTQGVAQANWREVGQQVKAVIYAGENADFSTWAHEMAHVFQAQLDGDLKTEAETAFNVVGGDWTRSTYTFSDGRTMSSAEAFAYGFQDWLETGKAESEQMKNIFHLFAEFIADAYNKLRQHLNFTPEIESVFNKLLDGDDTIMSKALKAAQEQEGEYRAGLKRAEEEKQIQKKETAQAEREEASEGTDFAENAPTAEDLLNGIEEAENETTEENNAIDDALEDLPLTDEEKTQIADVLKDESSTVVEKAEAATEAASSVYDDEIIPDDMFFQEVAGAGEALNKDNYFKNTYAQWKGVSEKELPKETPDYESASGSEYWYTDKGVYRRSNHWGKVASCYWYLNDEVKQTGTTKEIGYTDFSDIQKMEYADDREREIARIRRINYTKYIDNPDAATQSYLDMIKKDVAERIKRNENLNNTFGAEQARKEKELYDSITLEDVKNFNVPEWDSEKERTRLLFQNESGAVRAQFENTDKWLKAPNGKDSNLNEKQWLQVRTPSFKKWFGDWEKDPANASKVVDENGEPLVVYHGTDADFTIFDASKARANMDIQGNFFSPWDIDAQGYGPNVRAFYLNIRNPANSSQGYSSLNTYKGQNEAGIKARELLKSKGYDGVNNDNEEYITFEPNQIKSATDNNGNFDAGNPDILYQIAGEIGAENLDNSEVQEGVSRMQNLAIAKQMETDGKDAKAIRLATGWEKGADGKWRWEIADDYHLKNIKATNAKLEKWENRLKKAKKEYEYLTGLTEEEKQKKQRMIADMVKHNAMPEGTTLESMIEEAENELHVAEMLMEYDTDLDVEAALKRLIERGIDPIDFWFDMGESFYLPQLIDNPELFRAYPELEKVTIAFARKDVDNHMGGYNPEENSITIFPAGAKTYTVFLSVLAHEVQHAIQYIEGFAKGGSAEQFTPISVEKLEERLKEINNEQADIMTKYIPADDWLTIDNELMQKGLSGEEYREARINAISKYDNGEYKKLSEEAEEIRERIEEIEENAIEGQVELNDGRMYADEFEAYRSLSGEVEARNVQTRMKFTPEQRLNTLLAATEDVDRDDQIILFQTVYHGSGADFDKFDTENFGFSGEGSMSFGYGTYVTDDEDIARDYAERQRPYKRETLLYKGRKPEGDVEDFVSYLVEQSKGIYDTVEDIKKYVDEMIKREENAEKVDPDYISTVLDTYKGAYELLSSKDFDIKDITWEDNPKTRLYTVKIPDDGYFTWNQNLEDKSLKGIKEALKEKGVTNTERLDNLIASAEQWKNNPNATYVYGSNIYRVLTDYLGGQKEASNFLHSLGYTGIKYPAGTIHGNGNGAYNYVIFNDDDAKIVDKLLFQTQAELMDEARGFDSWQEFMEYCETVHVGIDEVSPIPSDSDAQWYQSFWEQAMGVQTEQEKNEEAVQAKNKKDGALPGAVDALFATMIKSDQQMVDEFLQAVADIDAMDLDSEEWQQAENAEDAAQREKIEQLKDFINITLSDYNWQTALKRIQGGHEISEGLRKRLIGEMTDSFKARDFRALYAEVMNDEQYAVAPEDSITAVLNKKLKKYHDIVKPNDDISRWSPERRKQLAEQLQNREIAAKIKNGSLKLDDELDAYIKSLNSQIKEKQKQFDELEAETKADYQRIADKEKRDLLKLHEQLLLARGKLKSRNTEVERKITKGLKITDKYRRITQNLNADYDEIFRKYSDLRNSITINAEVQATLDRQEQVAGLRDDLNAKQKEKNLTAEVKKMRIQLVKRTMRRVPFNRVDYNNARTVIVIQRMLEPNLLGGVNRFIGIDSVYLRGVISQLVTDSEYKEKIMSYLNHNAKASQAFADFKKKLEELKTIKDFDSWTAKDRKAAIRYLPKENWIRDLNLKQLAKEREESMDLDIGMEEVKRQVYDEKTGEPKTYKDKKGNEHNVTETAFRLKYDDEIGKLVQDAVGADMFDKIVNLPFSEWTTEDLEGLAQRIDEIYTEGRDLKAAKDEARKREANAIRKRIEDAIKETGITFNDDDTPEERERKQKEIDKILGMSSDIKGTEAAKPKGFKAKITRLLHSYSDMNVMRFARMLDGQSEGENYRMLYRKEDDCYNAKQRSMASRASTVNKVMADNKITEGDLAKVVKVPSLGTEFTVDELLYFLAADKDYVEDEKKLQRGLMGLDANDDFAATSRNAVMFGNMMSDMMSQEEKEAWNQLDKDLEDALKNDTLTQEQKEQQAAGTLDKKPGTTRYIMACHAKWEVVLGVANNYLSTHPEYKALLEAIEADYASQYERMNEVSINEFNMPVHRVKAYVPLVRRESNGDTNENQVREDLLGASGIGKQWADKGMTQRRVQISPLNQKPVQTGLFRTWGDSIERTEHFIAFAPYVRQLNAIYKSRDASYTRRFIESRYGAGAVKYLDEYINEVANPNAGRIRERGAEWLHILRGKTAPAYLGWKASGIIKQGLTSPWPYMQFVNPAEYLSAAMKFTFNPEMREAISEKSIYMKLRRMDPVNDLIDEMADNAKSKLDRGWSKFSQIGMQGLELIDWACVAPGWLACYEKKYNQLQKASEARYNAKMEELKERNMYADIGTSEYLSPQQMEAEARKEITEDIETEAVRYADDCTRACQPSNRVTDLAPLFKNSSEAMKAFLQFQTPLNVIWQNIRYDLPYAVKQKEFKRIAGTVIGYVMAGIFMNSVMDGLRGDDDDDDTQALRNLIYYSTTQFTDAIPIMGSEITNAMDKIITGKRSFSQSGTDMTPSATKLLNALQKATNGDFKKAASLTAEGIGLFMGAPVSGVKEINKLLGKPLTNGDVDLLRGLSDVYGIAGDILEE